MRFSIKPAKILDFDIENRPLTYYGGDLTTAEVTAIAAGWAHDWPGPGPSGVNRVVGCRLLGEVSAKEMLEWFRALYDHADIVTGHYIRKHDLSILNGAMVEAGLPPLGPKLTIDTKLDLIDWSFEAQPKSQQELALALGIDAPKIQMTQHDWRSANRLTPEGLALTRERVVGDVKQHKQLRLELHRRGLLRPAKVWSPR